MRKRALALALGCACLLFGGPAAAQDDDWDDQDEGEVELDRGRSSVYVSGRGLWAIDHFTGDNFQNGGRNFDRNRVQNSTGVDGRIGYRLGRIFAVEAEVEWIKGFDLNERIAANWLVQNGVLTTVVARNTAQFPEAVAAGAHIRTTRTAKWAGFTSTVNAKAYLLSGAFQPYLVVGGGVMYMHQEVQRPFTLGANPLKNRHDTGPAVRGGLGFEIYGFENDSIAVVAEGSYVSGFGDVEDYNYLTTSLGLLFRW